MARLTLASVCAVFVAACGSESVVPVLDAAADVAVEAAAPDVASDVAPDVAPDKPRVAAPYPAFIPMVPQVASLGGPVLAAPRLVPVFVADPAIGVDPDVARVELFLSAYARSQTWRTQLEEYGVGPGTVASAVHVSSAGLNVGVVSSARFITWLSSQIESGVWGVPDENTLFIVMLDGSRQIQLGTNRTCEGVGGYHSDLRGQSFRRVAYAVIPNCGRGTDALTRVLSHEIVEAATDPFPNLAPAFTQPSTQVPPEGAWAVAYTGGEVGDMCEQRSDASFRPDDLEFDVQRSWSNRAAAATLDPCVPAPAGAVYFNAVPSLPETLTLYGRDRQRTVSARGVIVPAGGSRVVDVRLFSTRPTTGSMRVSAREVTLPGQIPAFRFAWDHSTGLNGDVLHLTLTATQDAPEGRVFQVFVNLNGYNNNWAGGAATE